MKTTAVIVAAGAGTRMNATVPKAFMDLVGRPLIEHSLETFQAHTGISSIILVVPAEMAEKASASAAAFGKVAGVVAGGSRRQDSVKAGLDQAGRTADETDLVLVHDAARPLVPPGLITAVIEAAARTGAAVPGLPSADTIRIVNEDAGGKPPMAGETLDRSQLVRVQTPQGFRFKLLRDAYDRQGRSGADVTDDAALVQRTGHPVEIVAGSPRNFKITTLDDLLMAAACVP